MKIELIKELRHNYSDILVPDVYIGVGDGWFVILDNFFAELSIAKKTRYCTNNPDIAVAEVKEKFGSLRIRIADGNDYTAGLVAMATVLASRICEETGYAGVRKICNGYWKIVSPIYEKIHGGKWQTQEEWQFDQKAIGESIDRAFNIGKVENSKS